MSRRGQVSRRHLFSSYTFNMQQRMRRAPNPHCRSLNIHSNVSVIQPGACSYFTDLESVYIPPNVRVIRQNAFARCEVLRWVELNEGLKRIENFAFACCALEYIRIPSSVQDLEVHAFNECQNLLRVEFCEQIEALVTEVFLRDWWNQQINRDDVFLTYSWMTKNGIPDRLDNMIEVIEWKHEIHNMLRCISKPREWDTGTLTGHFRSIESKIASYEVLKGGVPSLDVAIMTHIFSYLTVASSNPGGAGGGELGIDEWS